MTQAQGVAAIPIWIWLILAVVFVGVPVVIIGVAVLLRARASRSAIRQADGPPPAARTQARRARWYGLGGLGVGVLLGVALVLDQRGGLAPLACAGGYLIGLLIGEYAAQPPARGQVRAATLRPRRPADYSPHWAVTAVLLAAVLTVAAPVAFAAAPSISYGRWRPFADAPFSLPGGRTVWPGWPLTTVAAVFAVVVVLLGAAGLRRVAARPRLTGTEPDPAGRGLDELLRLAIRPRDHRCRAGTRAAGAGRDPGFWQRRTSRSGARRVRRGLPGQSADDLRRVVLRRGRGRELACPERLDQANAPESASGRPRRTGGPGGLGGLGGLGGPGGPGGLGGPSGDGPRPEA